MQEIWLPVSGFEGLYEVSNMGEFRSLERIVFHNEGKFLRKIKARNLVKTKDKQGRNYIVFSKNGKASKVRVHLIVAKHFIGPNPDNLEVCHNDGNNSNNCVTNLRYGTHKSNMEDMAKHGNSQRGEKCYYATTKEQQVHEIRKLRASGMIYKDIAATLGVGYYSVAKLCAGSRWTWLE